MAARKNNGDAEGWMNGHNFHVMSEASAQLPIGSMSADTK
jgi:hypothetical protein